MQPFKINDEYTVYPDTNSIDTSVKLEPRLMKLLCLLAATPGTLVTRDEIIEKIWNGYGGGDEGLTQAISNLRKVLDDTGKSIIETVPKGGYIFRGNIGPVNEAVPMPVAGKSLTYKTAGIIAALMILIFALILYLELSGRNVTPKPPAERSQPGAAAPKAPN